MVRPYRITRISGKNWWPTFLSLRIEYSLWWHISHRRYCVLQFFCCCARSLPQYVFTDPLPSNELFRLSGVMSQYSVKWKSNVVTGKNIHVSSMDSWFCFLGICIHVKSENRVGNETLWYEIYVSSTVVRMLENWTLSGVGILNEKRWKICRKACCSRHHKEEKSEEET
jgi:hypothetical protein